MPNKQWRPGDSSRLKALVEKMGDAPDWEVVSIAVSRGGWTPTADECRERWEALEKARLEALAPPKTSVYAPAEDAKNALAQLTDELRRNREALLLVATTFDDGMRSLREALRAEHVETRKALAPLGEIRNAATATQSAAEATVETLETILRGVKA